MPGIFHSQRSRTMQIEKDSVVTLSIKVAHTNGQLIYDGKEPSSYLHGGYDNIFPKIEAALEGQAKGFQTTLALTAEDAFGARDDALVTTMDKKDFPPGVKVGGQLEGPGSDGQRVAFTVTKIKGPVVHLDGNHPLAGVDLKLSIKVLDVRAATAEEITHKHAHGDHGHHH